MLILLSLISVNIGRAAPAGAGKLAQAALERVAARTGLPLAQLQVIHRSEVQYPFLGRSATHFKVVDRSSGNIHSVALNGEGREVNAEALYQRERAAHIAKYGKLDPQLYETLKSASDQAPIAITVWLKEPASATTRTARPLPPASGKERTSAELEAARREVDAAYVQADRERAQAIKPLVDGAATKLAAFDAGVTGDMYAPALYARLTPAALRQVAQWPEVDQIYLSTKMTPELNVARSTINANTVHNQGFTGTGVRLGQIEIGGRVATGNPSLSGVTQNTTYVCASASSHSTGVAGIINSRDATIRGIAPNATLWAGGSCSGSDSELQNRSTAAADWGATAINLSWGGDTNLVIGANDRFYDTMVINRYRTIVKSAGNRGAGCGGEGDVTSPGLAYNIITVGNFNDNGTVGWGDDSISNCSSWGDPISTHNDREKPEVAAPGTNITTTSTSSPWTNYTNSGTSFAAPMVTGAVGLMVNAEPTIANWPEAIKAIMMATAVHNIEGATRLSESDGAGGINVQAAVDVARGLRVNGWRAQAYDCNSPADIDFNIALNANVRTRVTTVWDNNPAYSDYSNRPSADLDISIYHPNGSYVTGSASWDNTYEIVEFTPNTTGSYRLRIHRLRCDYSPSWLAWSWFQQ